MLRQQNIGWGFLGLKQRQENLTFSNNNTPIKVITKCTYLIACMVPHNISHIQYSVRIQTWSEAELSQTVIGNHNYKIFMKIKKQYAKSNEHRVMFNEDYNKSEQAKVTADGNKGWAERILQMTETGKTHALNNRASVPGVLFCLSGQ